MRQRPFSKRHQLSWEEGELRGLKQTAKLTPSGTRELCPELKMFRPICHQKVNTRPETRSQCLKEKPVQSELTISAYSTFQSLFLPLICPDYKMRIVIPKDEHIPITGCAAEMAHQFRIPAAAPGNQHPHGSPQPSCGSSSRASNALFWPPQALYTHEPTQAHTHMHAHEKQNNKKTLKIVLYTCSSFQPIFITVRHYTYSDWFF